MLNSSPALTTIYAGFVPGHTRLNSIARLVHRLLVRLLPVGILNLFSLFELFGSTQIISMDCLETSSISYFCMLFNNNGSWLVYICPGSNR